MTTACVYDYQKTQEYQRSLAMAQRVWDKEVQHFSYARLRQEFIEMLACDLYTNGLLRIKDAAPIKCCTTLAEVAA